MGPDGRKAARGWPGTGHPRSGWRSWTKRSVLTRAPVSDPSAVLLTNVSVQPSESRQSTQRNVPGSGFGSGSRVRARDFRSGSPIGGPDRIRDTFVGPDGRKAARGWPGTGHPRSGWRSWTKRSVLTRAPVSDPSAVLLTNVSVQPSESRQSTQRNVPGSGFGSGSRVRARDFRSGSPIGGPDRIRDTFVGPDGRKAARGWPGTGHPRSGWRSWTKRSVLTREPGPNPDPIKNPAERMSSTGFFKSNARKNVS